MKRASNVITFNQKPTVGYRFLDYEVYKVTDTHIWVVNWVTSEQKIFEYVLK